MTDRYERIIQQLQQRIANEAAASSTQIAVLQVDLEAAQAEIEELRGVKTDEDNESPEK